jgi:hypothetical protein
MKYKHITLIAAVLVGVLVLAACGSDSDDVPSLRTTGNLQAVEPTADAAASVRDNEARMMALTQCLRDQGIEVRDPVVDSEGNVGKPQLVDDSVMDKEQWGPAWETCAVHLEGFTWEKERVDVSEQLDRFLALTACLSDKGYDVDEPTAETLDQWQSEFKEGLNWKDPATEDDFNECASQSGVWGAGK